MSERRGGTISRALRIRRWGRRRLRTLAALGLTAVLAVLILPPVTAAPAGTVYKIGFIASTSGPGASLGIPERFVARVIQDQLRAEGGIAGPDGVRHEVQILINDDQSSADVAAGLARRMIEQERVPVMVAGTLTGPSLAMVPIATDARTPMISMASARAIIEDPQARQVRPWIFKPVPENLHSAQRQAEYLKAVKVAAVCHLYENTAYGQDTFASAQAIFPKEGIRILYGDAFDRTATEFPQLTRVRASGCQAVVIGSIPPAASLITVGVFERVGRRRIIHGHGACSPDLIATAGRQAEGNVMPCGKILVAEQLPANDPTRTLNLALIRDYSRVAGGQPISTFAGHAYDALQWALAALRALPDGQPLDRQRAAVREALETRIKDFPGTHGLFTLSPTDHLGWNPRDFVIVTVSGGRFVILPREQWK